MTVTSRKKASTGARSVASARIAPSKSSRPTRSRAAAPADGDDVGEILFRWRSERGRIVLAGEGLGAVLLFLGAQDVGGAAIAGEQVLAVLGVEQPAERLDPADDHEQIVLAGQREHRVDQIVPRALVAEVDFEAVGEEGEEVARLSARSSPRVKPHRHPDRPVWIAASCSRSS